MSRAMLKFLPSIFSKIKNKKIFFFWVLTLGRGEIPHILPYKIPFLKISAFFSREKIHVSQKTLFLNLAVKDSLNLF
jgi:hypothetical protein